MAAYYNEIDPKKAAWLRELIKRGLIAAGDVDERSIVDVRGSDLAGYAQCHFFAGIGIWSYALRLAEWSDERPVWTGSCPCPSFSVAGQGKGLDDPRHLWPHWMRLIRECKPHAVFGEQVSAAIGYGWLDLVQHDLEAEAYAVGKVVFPACGVGAPHTRQRLYFVGRRGWPDADEMHANGWHRSLQVGRQRSERKDAPVSFWRGVERGGEPRPAPLAPRAAFRMVRMCGYGDGIVSTQAAEFIKAVMEANR